MFKHHHDKLICLLFIQFLSKKLRKSLMKLVAKCNGTMNIYKQMKKSIGYGKTYPLEEILTALDFLSTLMEKLLAFYEKPFS